MDTIVNILTFVLFAGLAFTTVWYRGKAKRADQRIARLNREQDAAGTLVSVLLTASMQDTEQIFDLMDEKHDLEQQNSAMWNFIRKDVPLPDDMQPVPFTVTDPLDFEGQPALFQDEDFKFFEPTHEQAIATVTDILGGQVIS